MNNIPLNQLVSFLQVGSVVGSKSFGEKLMFIFQNPLSYSLYFSTFFFLSVIYFFSIRFNRPKAKDVFLPVFKPPFGLSPASVRYIYLMGFDTKCLVVAMMNAAVKGCYKLRWGKNGFMATLSPGNDMKALNREEFLAFSLGDKKFRDKIVFSSRISFQNLKMSLNLDRYLMKHFGKLINKRQKTFLGGIILSSACLFLIFYFAGGSELTGMFFLYYLITWTCIIVPVALLNISLQDKFWFGMLVCCVYLAGGLIGIFTLETRAGMPFFFPVVLPFVLLHLIVYPRLASPTPTGQKVLDEILAYRKYLAADFAKINSMDDLNEDRLKALPYVVALDVETRFTPFFNDLLSKAEYSPYHSFEKN